MTIESIAEERVDERDEAECPNCGAVALEPRSGNAWLCTGCARRLTPEEVVR